MNAKINYNLGNLEMSGIITVEKKFNEYYFHDLASDKKDVKENNREEKILEGRIFRFENKSLLFMNELDRNNMYSSNSKFVSALNDLSNLISYFENINVYSYNNLSFINLKKTNLEQLLKLDQSFLFSSKINKFDDEFFNKYINIYFFKEF